MQFIKLLIALSHFAWFISHGAELPTLKTKQSLVNIRFISHDGKFTYYQRRSGDLQLSTNYSNEVVLEGPKLAEYLIYSSQAKKKLLIEVDKNYHDHLSYLKTNDIYLVDYGGFKAEKIAEGTLPKLHLKDTYVSYFTPGKNIISIVGLANNKKKLAVALNNSVNPYFRPEVYVVTPQDVIYSDLNSQGYSAFLIHSTIENKTETIYKSSFPGIKLEACLAGENLIVGEFSYDGIDHGSKIIKIPLFNNKDFKNFSLLYQSQQNDIGNMACDEDKMVYFIKTTSYDKEINLKKTEVASLDLKTNKINVLSKLNYVTQIINMDGMIIAPFRGRYYIVKGNADLTQDALETKKETVIKEEEE